LQIIRSGESLKKRNLFFFGAAAFLGATSFLGSSFFLSCCFWSSSYFLGATSSWSNFFSQQLP
jgi:hypothetical protein